MTLDPIVTNPNHDKVIFENDQVRVLEYTDHRFRPVRSVRAEARWPVLPWFNADRHAPPDRDARLAARPRVGLHRTRVSVPALGTEQP